MRRHSDNQNENNRKTIDDPSLEKMKALWQQRKTSTSAPENLRPIHAKKAQVSLSRLFIPATALSVMFGAFIIYKLPDSALQINSEPLLDISAYQAEPNNNNADHLMRVDELESAELSATFDDADFENSLDLDLRAKSPAPVQSLKQQKKEQKTFAKAAPEARMNAKPVINTNHFDSSDAVLGEVMAEKSSITLMSEEQSFELAEQGLSSANIENIEAEKAINKTSSVFGIAQRKIDENGQPQWWLKSCEFINHPMMWKMPTGNWQAGQVYQAEMSNIQDNNSTPRLTNIKTSKLPCLN